LTFRMRDLCYLVGPVVGYSTRRHILVDIDNANVITLYRLPAIISRLLGYSNYIVCLSSVKKIPISYSPRLNAMTQAEQIRLNFHIVFEKSMLYDLATNFYHLLQELGIVHENYVEMRLKRGDATLRISPKGVIPPPLPLFYRKSRPMYDENLYAYLMALEAFREVPEEWFNLALSYERAVVLTFQNRLVPDGFRTYSSFVKLVREALAIFAKDSADLALAPARRRLQVEGERDQKPLQVSRL